MKVRVDRESFPYRLSQLIFKAAGEVVGKRGVKLQDVTLEHPANPSHGDYSSNLALRLNSKKYKSPWDLANEIVNVWRTQGLPDYLKKVEVAQPGFINLWLKKEALISEMNRVIKEKEKFGSSAVLKGKKFLLEHTSPNPQTTIMLGHLRNNFLGMTVANLFEFLGAKVTKDCIVNDRGVHLCRAIWGYLVFGRKRQGLTKTQLLNFKKVTDSQLKKAIVRLKWQDLLAEWVKRKSSWWQPQELGLKPDHANLIWYVLGSRAYKLSEKVKKQVEEILLAWEAEEKGVWAIWRQILDWSAKGYEATYQRVGSSHDWVWHESDHYQQGKEIVKEGLKKKVFRQSEGAVVTNLGEYGLPDTVVVKADGTALYITQDLALTKLKIQKFSSDLYIWDIGAEQTLYFKQLFAICEQLGIAKREALFHLNYALINFRGGKKMATRKGEVVKADEVLDELHHRALAIIQASNQELRGKLTEKQLDDLAEKVAVGAIKYSLLKFSRETTIQFDIDESLALEGDSAPYLQYTSSRCQSVLGKKKDLPTTINSESKIALETEEEALLRLFYRFPEVVREAAENYSPNLICNFLFDLAQKYNLFYNKHSILKAASEELQQFRLALTLATNQILKNGLHLLGIETPARM